LGHDLPSADEALTDASERLTSGGTEASGEVGRLFPRRVWQAAITRLAHRARPLLGVDVVSQPVADEAFLDALAQFLWDSRGLVASQKEVER
jgi:hypothetical protein